MWLRFELAILMKKPPRLDGPELIVFTIFSHDNILLFHLPLLSASGDSSPIISSRSSIIELTEKMSRKPYL